MMTYIFSAGGAYRHFELGDLTPFPAWPGAGPVTRQRSDQPRRYLEPIKQTQAPQAVQGIWVG